MKVQKVLVVDNSPVMQRMVQLFFEKRGCEVKIAEDGFVALETLEKFYPDLMVVDLVMPKIGGEELCRIVRNRKQHRNTAIIILSAIIAECEVDFEALQVDACIAKEDPKGISRSFEEVLIEIESGRTRKTPPRLYAQKTVAHREISEELLHKARHYEVILQSMTDIFIELTPERRILQLNKAALELLGKEEDVLGKELAHFFPEGEWDRLERMIDALSFSSVQPPQEFHLNDKIIRLSLFASPAGSSGQEESILLFGNEITEHFRLEGDLRQILNTAADGIVVIDRDFKILKANDTFLEMFQENKDVIGRQCYDVLLGASCKTAQCPMIQIFEKKEAIEFEEEKYRRDGTGISCLIKATPYTDHNGNLVGIVEDFRDITPRKIAEDAVKESEERFRDILDNSPDLIQNVSPEGKFIYVNPAWKKTLEYDDEDVKKLYLSDILTPGVKKQCLEKFKKVLGEKNVVQIETEFIAKSGRVVSVIGSASCKRKGGKSVYTRGIFRDITLEKVLEEKLRYALEELEVVFNASLVGISLLKGDRIVARINQRMADILGYSPDELIDRSVRRWHLSEENYREFGSRYFAKLAHNELINVEYPLKKKDGTIIWCQLSGKAIAPPHLDQGVIWIIDDISKRKILEEKLRNLATTDDLTGLYNRRMFSEICKKEISRAKRHHKPFSLAIFDIDYFKNINDTYGHDKGDFVLKAMAQLCVGKIRQDDSLGRWGGEEFVLLLPDTALREARELCERLRQAIAEYSFDQLPQVTVSFGLTEVVSEDSVEKLVKRADQALYAAKKSGRNKVCVH